MQCKEVVIIGAGLTGLALAYYLKRAGVDAMVVEARDRIGGRIHTKYDDELASIELGATWLGSKHGSLLKLLEELDIDTHVQLLGDHAVYEPISTSPPQIVKLPSNDDPSFRIRGGTSAMINALYQKLDSEHVLLSTSVERIVDRVEDVLLETTNGAIVAKQIVSTLPPYLFINTIKCEPDLPVELMKIANHTHTWMGESIKVGLTYKNPFWKEVDTSGTIFSSVGPIGEMYDHSHYEDSRYALKGFLNGAYHSATRDHRIDIIMNQLSKYYGEQVRDYSSYEEAIWAHENYTYLSYNDHILPHQNNGHRVYQRPYYGGRLHIAGAETALSHPGYMEGAASSALEVYGRLGFNG